MASVRFVKKSSGGRGRNVGPSIQEERWDSWEAGPDYGIGIVGKYLGHITTSRGLHNILNIPSANQSLMFYAL